MYNFPDSVWLEIFTYLSKRDLLTAAKVSRRWKRISLDKSLWKEISSSELNVPEDKLNDDMLKILFDGRYITSVSLINCVLVSNRSLITLSLTSSRLKHLNLEGCGKISDRGIMTLAKHCTTLETINLHGTRVSEKGICCLLSENLNIIELKASTMAMTETSIQVLAGHCKNLEYLCIEQNMTYSPQKLKYKCDNLTSNMLMLLAINCPNLIAIILQYEIAQIHDWAIACLGHNCPKLEFIEIGELDPNLQLSDSGIINLCSPLKNLQHLVLTETAITDYTIHALACTCRDLKTLDLKNCRKLSDIGVLSLLRNCTELESLTLGGGWDGRLSNVSAYAVARSACTKNLISLAMYFWEITDSALFLVAANLTRLLYLSIEGCTFITIEGLKQSLDLLQNVVELNLSFTECVSNDEELLSLALYLETLQKLFIFGCRGITVAGLIKLKSFLPNCTIASDIIYLQ